jgi:hypothetical protein
MEKSRAIITAIFFASLSSISYEIALIRMFSISLWYHFAFMVISIAMLGIGVSGTILSVYPALRNLRNIPLYLLMLSICIPLSYLITNLIPFEPARLSWDRIQIFYITLYYIVLSLPFFFFGLIVSTAFSTIPGNTGLIYGADLTGAGTGSMLALYLLSSGGPERIVFIVSSLSIISLLIFGSRRVKIISVIFMLVNLIILHVNPAFIGQKISAFKPFQVAMKFPGAEHLRTYQSPFSRVDIFRSPAVRFAPGLSFKYLEDLPEQVGISVDAGEIYAMTKYSNKDALGFIRYLPSALPYELSRKNSVLILEPKGGLTALIAEYYKAGDIYKIDSNPVVIKAVREYSRGFSSDIYGSNTWAGIGRGYLFSFNKKFDIIDLSVMGSMPSGSFGFSEDYRFTVEAFTEYLSHLNIDGILALNLFIIPPPRTELRLINTVVVALEELGIKDPGRHIAALRSWGTISIIVKMSELSKNDIATMRNFAGTRRFDLLYYPGISESETNLYIRMPSNEYFDAFNSLISNETRDRFNEDYIFDIRPVHDENPFFHYYLKLGNIREIYRLMGGKWQYFIEEGYLLPVIFLQVMFLSILLILLPAVKLRGSSSVNSSLIFSLSYFALLGIGFMFVEISFIQRMILLLENPPYAVASVISSMLISSGIGSLLSQHFKLLHKPRVIIVLSLIILLYGLFLPRMTGIIYPYSLNTKIFFVFFVLMPAGILMGIPFPIGLSHLSKNNPQLVPWAWAVNGYFSVLAPILAIMLAISAGFTMVIIIGTLVYVFAFFCLEFYQREIRGI